MYVYWTNLIYVEHDRDITYMIMYCRYQGNSYVDVFKSLCYNNSAGGSGGAMYL